MQPRHIVLFFRGIAVLARDREKDFSIAKKIYVAIFKIKKNAVPGLQSENLTIPFLKVHLFSFVMKKVMK